MYVWYDMSGIVYVPNRHYRTQCKTRHGCVCLDGYFVCALRIQKVASPDWRASLELIPVPEAISMLAKGVVVVLVEVVVSSNLPFIMRVSVLGALLLTYRLPSSI